METGPIKKQTLTDQAIQRVERMIETGVWPVGSRIPPEPELVRAFGVSRNCLREAIKSLIHVGVLEARQGDGTYVRSKSSLNAMLSHRFGKAAGDDIIEVRRCLEKEIARLAALRRTDDDVAELRKRLALAVEAYRAGDLDRYVREDFLFHLGIARATRNGLLISLYESISESVQRSVDAYLDHPENSFEDTIRLHERLLEAVSARNAEMAEQVVLDLLQRNFF